MPPSPRVRCGGCAFEWYGATASHGLRIVGSCPRCSGTLEFLVPDEDVADPEPVTRNGHAADPLRSLAPAAVLGTPTSWAR